MLGYRSVFSALLFLIGILLFLFGAIDYTMHRESNRCKMSYMFYRPFLTLLTLRPPPPPKFQGYRLFFYCSGECRPFATDNVSPILFLPGTRGSFKTIRSFASAQDYFQHYESPSDFFAVDFNEETTALSGNAVERQAEFLSLVIDAILSLYTHSVSPPKSVMIVGHSLGVLAAARLLADDRFDQSKITTVISLAGPLLDPIYSPGPVMDRVYARIGAYFKRTAKDPNNSLLIVSLTGGSRDFLVSDVLGAVDYHSPGLNVLWLSTSSVSWVWASCDHLCILWCRQLMHSLTFAVQDLKAISSSIDQLNVSRRLQVFRDRLITRFIRLERPTLIPSGRTSTYQIPLDRLPPSRWVFLTGQLNFRYTGLLSPEGQFTKIGPFFRNAEQRLLIVTNRVFHDWLFLCNVPKYLSSSSNIDHIPCSEFTPLVQGSTSSVTWFPDVDSAFPRGLALLTLPHNLPTNQSSSSGVLHPGSYLVLAHPPPMTSRDTQIEVIVETFTDPSERVLSMAGISLHWHRPVLVQLKRLGSSYSSTNPQLSVFHRIHFPSTHFLFGPSFPAPRLIVASSGCSVDTYDRGLVALFAPWANYFYHTFVRRNSSALLDLDVPVPPTKGSDNGSLFVDLLLKPYCTYNISIQFSIFQWLAKLLRLHWAHLFGLICGHLWLELWLLMCLQLVRHKRPCVRSIPLPERNSVSSLTVDVNSLTKQSNSVLECSSETSTRKTSDSDPTYLTSAIVHLCAVWILFLSQQFAVLPWSDWDRLYRYNHLGLRYVDPEPRVVIGKSTPFSTRLIGHLPFLVLTLPVSLIIPGLTRLLVRTTVLAVRAAAYCSRTMKIDRYNNLTLNEYSVRQGRLISFVFFFGLITWEALGVILLAGHMFFQVYTIFYPHITRYGRGSPSTCPIPSPTDKARSLLPRRRKSDNSSGLLVPLFSFYWHCVLVVMIVLDSLFLVENWMDLAQALWRYHTTGYRNITLLFHNPVFRADWYATSALIATAITDWLLVRLGNREQISFGDLTSSRYIPTIVSFAGSAMCAIGLFHTALMGCRLALLSSCALQLLLIGATFYSTCPTSSSPGSQPCEEFVVKSKAD